MSFYPVNNTQRASIRPLFPQFEHETMVLAYYQGYYGSAWCDDPDSPKAALIIGAGNFRYIGGDHTVPAAEELAALAVESDGLLSPGSGGWRDLILGLYPERVQLIERYAFYNDASGFDLERLRQNVGSLPDGFTMARIDAPIAERLSALDWAFPCDKNFGSVEDFLARGIGFCVLDGETPVSAALSYSLYDGGIEVEIDTAGSHRRMGLARCAASALILAVTEQGKFASWDAANSMSRDLALSLGYRLKGPYDCLRVGNED